MYFWAAKKIDISVVQDLIKIHKNDVNHVAANGKSVVFYAAQNSMQPLDTFKLLHEAGADFSKCEVNGTSDCLAVYMKFS